MAIFDRIAVQFLRFAVILVLVGTSGCADVQQYTSKDLTILPCERRANEFFLPLEFDKGGRFIYPDQVAVIEAALRSVEHIYVFVHGWDKTAKTAERDYQELICRFYTHSRNSPSTREGAIIIGIFWPSEEFPRWVNFWRMKNRADQLAETGFPKLMEIIADASARTDKGYKLAFIGHSFGGRIVVSGLRDYLTKINGRTFAFLSRIDRLQLVLLNAAIGEHAFLPQAWRQLTREYSALKGGWMSEGLVRGMTEEYGQEFIRDKVLVDMDDLRLYWIPTMTELAGIVDLRIYNVMSTRDSADLYLYRIGSIGEEGGPTCAIGACGLKQWDYSVQVLSDGSLESPPDLLKSNVWNVDASQVILSHSDIYKGRVANFLWELLSLKRPELPPGSEINVPPSSVESSRQQWSIGNDVFYDMFRRENIYAMTEVNRLRMMGEEEQDRAKKFVSLAFDLSGELERKSWRSAEVTIRSMIELNGCYPGWHFQQSLGYVKQGRFWDSTYFTMVRKGFCGDTLRYILALTAAFQGRCPDALQELEKIKMGTLNMVSWVDSLKDMPELQRLFPAEAALVSSCRLLSSTGHQ